MVVVFATAAFTPLEPTMVVVIDAGHGGKDPGARNNQLKINEKSMVLDLARRLKRKLEKYGYKTDQQGAPVIINNDASVRSSSSNTQNVNETITPRDGLYANAVSDPI